MKKTVLFLTAMIMAAFLTFNFHSLTAQDLPENLQIGKHTVAEWKNIIDKTWGDGMPTENKLLLFDRFWEDVDKKYPGFVNNPVNWDSVKNHYRPEIEAGVSQGRFAGIITKMGLLLNEGHSYAYNRQVYQTEPGPGVPIVIPGHYRNPDLALVLNNGWFGATLTPINDEELLVLRSEKDHPMGLEAGDIVLGYDGVLWKDLYPLLLKMDFPLSTNSRTKLFYGTKYFDYLGSSAESAKHKWLASAGMNWHLFNTLDFKKYGSDEILHLPTSLLEGREMNIPGNEQLPVEGIKFRTTDIHPDSLYTAIPPVCYNTVLDNSIGYMYFSNMSLASCVKKLEEASQSMVESNVRGIILDLRYNTGGYAKWENGLSPIFNRGVESSGLYVRANNGVHEDLHKTESYYKAISEDFLNKPIALITGPGAIGAGDYASYFIHSQPMTRSFGKATNSSFMLNSGRVTTLNKWNCGSVTCESGFADFDIQFAGMSFGSMIDGELKHFMHTGFDVDEEIWFTPEAAYEQEDNLVERAMDWINSVAYADAFKFTNPYHEQGVSTGSIELDMDIINPENHTYALYVNIYNEDGSFITELRMKTREKRRFADFRAKPGNFYYATVSTHDQHEKSILSYPGKLHFASVSKPEINPKVIKDWGGETVPIEFTLKNTSGKELKDLRLHFSCDNSCIDIKKPWLNFTHLLDAGKTALERQVITFEEISEATEAWVQVDIYSGANKYWSDSIQVTNLGVSSIDPKIQSGFKIYPNPMKESCRIRVNKSISLESIELYDLSGRLVFSKYNLESSSFELPKGNLEHGIYLLKVIADKPYERKLVIQ